MEDANRVDCSIVVAFIFSGVIDPIDFWHRKSRILIEHLPPILKITIFRRVSERLCDNIRLFRFGDQFIVSYVNSLMPAINRKLLDNRYLSGHPFCRTLSLLEALGIDILYP